MSLFNQSAPMVSPIQNHPVIIFGDTQIVQGDLETLGMPHPYINQSDLELIKVENAIVSPWSHLGLPTNKKELVMVYRDNIQLLSFTDQATVEQYQQPQSSHTMLITLPIAILRGKVPFMSDANISNFLEFFRSTFIPVMDAEVHYFVSTGMNVARKMPLVYLNRNFIQSYVDAE